MDSNLTPSPTNQEPTQSGSNSPPSPPLSTGQLDNVATPTRWYQETINNLLGRINPQTSQTLDQPSAVDSSTSPAPQSSTSSPEEVPDDNQNEAYVQLQSEYDQFLQAIMNPETRSQTLAAFDQELAAQRPQFPTAPGQPAPSEPQDYQQALNRLASGVNPPDGSMLAAANQIPADVLAAGILANLAEYLPPQY